MEVVQQHVKRWPVSLGVLGPQDHQDGLHARRQHFFVDPQVDPLVVARPRRQRQHDTLGGIAGAIRVVEELEDHVDFRLLVADRENLGPAPEFDHLGPTHIDALTDGDVVGKAARRRQLGGSGGLGVADILVVEEGQGRWIRQQHPVSEAGIAVEVGGPQLVLRHHVEVQGSLQHRVVEGVGDAVANPQPVGPLG